MTKSFERFLRSFSDEELTRFAHDRHEAQPPYWRMLRLALRVEVDRRGLWLEPGVLEPAASGSLDKPRGNVSA